MLNKNNTGLIVVDIQGKLATLMQDSEALIANTAKLIQGAKILGLPIVWLEQNPTKLGGTTPVLRDLLQPLQPIEKLTFSGAKTPAFMQAVEHAQVKNWLVCGIEAHICVYQTACELHQLGFHVELVTDCIASRSADNKSLAMHKLSALGVGISGLEMCLYELLEDCQIPAFKSILALIK